MISRRGRRRPSFRAIAIGFALACGCSTPALADCGWILWLQTTRLEVDKDSKGVIEPGVWEPLQGFDQFAACQTAMVAERKSYKDFRVPVVGGGTISYTHKVTCFPSGFDPRPRPKSD
jgi:hypothetical protein